VKAKVEASTIRIFKNANGIDRCPPKKVFKPGEIADP